MSKRKAVGEEDLVSLPEDDDGEEEEEYISTGDEEEVSEEDASEEDASDEDDENEDESNEVKDQPPPAKKVKTTQPSKDEVRNGNSAVEEVEEEEDAEAASEEQDESKNKDKDKDEETADKSEVAHKIFKAAEAPAAATEGASEKVAAAGGKED